jgi:hypothetical protein
MGQLQDAKMVYDAPWNDATPEENAAYNTQVQQGNTEFESDVRQQMSPQAAQYVDADRAQFHPSYVGRGNRSTQGAYMPDEFETDQDFQDAMVYKYGDVMQQADMTLAADQVYVFGARNATSETYAHEFEHRRHAKEDIKYSFSDEEPQVRKQIAFRANTPEQWATAVDSWRFIMLGRAPKGTSITLDEAEKHLKNTLKTAENKFLEEETKYLDEKGSRPSSRKWAIDSHSADAREALERRQKSWNLKNSVQYKQMKARQAAEAGKKAELAKAIEDLQISINEAAERKAQQGN